MEYRRPEKYASFDIDEPVLQTLATNGIETLRVRAPSINDERVVRAVRAGAPSYFIFGGGGILRKEMLSTGKRFIHVHPGDLPGFRGSHCIEWAVLERARCAASAIFMSEAIDEGDLIARRRFPRPELENNAIAPLYSAHIRSELLVQVVSRFAKEGRFQAKKQPAGGQTYYKMHPALTNLVFHELLGAGERE
ncbi:MAG: hypothetical protein JXR37_12810 [Kiritimatiellae bacterium]|nr:hypothetical protein [Kiritimatiellia bacterium]